ncbi:hypothetical protein [Oceanirhabdus seepicola]|uniref:hypothetical protein n=1 Tax=Oceanirhabdus seepicola TaxID=2828781 RepID=UPI002032B5A9|nr:hypothetical protein [Oceanirhabdus seepicola]
MATYRVIKDKDNPFVMINKHGIYDSNLSWKAKGLLMYFMSRPDNWDFHEVEIKKHARDGKDGIKSGIKELINNNYIRRTRTRYNNGKFRGWMYEVYEVPFEETKTTGDECKNKHKSVEPIMGKPTLENPTTGKSTVVNPPIINNEFNNNDLNNNRFIVNNEIKKLKEVEEKERGVNHGDRGDSRENKRSSSIKRTEEERDREEGRSGDGQALFNEEDLI